MPVAEEEKLHSRQSGILPPDGLYNCTAAIAGVGAVGSQLAQQLILCGQKQLRIYDHDEVEEVNLYPQGWGMEELGLKKTDALASRLRTMRPDADIVPCPTKFPLVGVDVEVLFLCVDSIETRRQLFEHYYDKVELLVDMRVAAETIRVISACEMTGWDYYNQTLFGADQAFQGGCTTKMTLHHANLAAAIAVQQYSLWLRSIPMERDLTLNALAMEMSNS